MKPRSWPRAMFALWASLPGCLGSSVVGELAVDGADASTVAPPADAAPDPVTLQSQSWYSAMTDLGAITAVAEAGADLAVFGANGMQWLSGGAVAARDPSVTMWRDAASVPAGDGTATPWILGVDGAGHLWRVRNHATLEDVTARYGLAGAGVHTIAMLDATHVVFGTDQGFAIADGMQVLRWDDAAFTDVAAGFGRVAAKTATGVRVFDSARRSFVDYAVTDASTVAFDGGGRLVVGTSSGLLWREHTDGTLWVSAPNAGSAIVSVVQSGDALWVATQQGLGFFDAAQGVRFAARVTVPMDARLRASSDGGVWVLGGGTVARYSRTTDPLVSEWEQHVRPVFAQRCTPCHLPGGTANIDLSRYGYWVDELEAIRLAVLVQQRMPLPPSMLTADERAAIAHWIAAASAPPGDASVEAGVDASVDASADGSMDGSTMDATGDGGAVDAARDATATDVPRDVVTTDVPRDAVATDVPRDATATDAGAADVPRDAVTTDVPRDATTTDAGAADVPRDAASTDTGAADVPRDATSSDAGVADVPRDATGTDAGDVPPG